MKAFNMDNIWAGAPSSSCQQNSVFARDLGRANEKTERDFKGVGERKEKKGFLFSNLEERRNGIVVGEEHGALAGQGADSGSLCQ